MVGISRPRSRPTAPPRGWGLDAGRVRTPVGVIEWIVPAIFAALPSMSSRVRRRLISDPGGQPRPRLLRPARHTWVAHSMSGEWWWGSLLVGGGDGRCGAPVRDLETSQLVAGGNGEGARCEGFSARGACPGMEHPRDSDVEVESFGADSEGKVVRGAATVVSHCGRDVDGHRPRWAHFPPRFRFVHGSPSFEHIFDSSVTLDYAASGRRGKRRPLALPYVGAYVNGAIPIRGRLI
jgi:hypothetical protein